MRFSCERLPFSSRRLRTEARVGFVACRVFGLRARRASSARIFCRQRSRFCSWLRDSRLTTVMPVGTCRMRTAESAVFTPCPPGPDAWNASARHCRASSSADRREKRA